MPKYVDAGAIMSEPVTGRVLEEGDLRYLVKCDGCGALVNGGGLSREKHDGFHAALADLFAKLALLTEDK